MRMFHPQTQLGKPTLAQLSQRTPNFVLILLEALDANTSQKHLSISLSVVPRSSGVKTAVMILAEREYIHLPKAPRKAIDILNLCKQTMTKIFIELFSDW
jgi:hypothetical protein